MIRIISLNVQFVGPAQYRAMGRTDDGQYVAFSYRRPRFTMGIGSTEDDARGDNGYTTDQYPYHDPRAINLDTLREWTTDQPVEWAVKQIGDERAGPKDA